MNKTIKINTVLAFALLFLFSFALGAVQIDQHDNSFVCTFLPDNEIHYLGYFSWTLNGQEIKVDNRDVGSADPIDYGKSIINNVELNSGDELKCTVYYALTAPEYGILTESKTLVKDSEPVQGKVTIDPVYPYPSTEELTCSADLPDESAGYYWYNKYNSLVAQTKVLTAVQAGGFHVGDIFKCVVKNELALPNPYIFGSAVVTVIRDPSWGDLSVSIESPADMIVVADDQQVHFSALVSGGSGNYQYEWSSNNTGVLSTDSSFDTTLQAGVHLITLTVNDTSSDLVAKDTVIVSVKQAGAPDISIVSPSENDHFIEGDQIHFSAKVTGTYDSVMWLSDNNIIGQSLDFTTTLPAGPHTITLVVTDTNHIPSTSQKSIHIEVLERDTPKISILFPNDGDVFKLGDTIWFIGASSNDNIISWTWSSDRDGVLSYDQVFSTSSLSPGTHKITLQTMDSYGAMHEMHYTINVVVNLNDFNAVSIISPSNNDHFKEGQNVLLSASVNSPESFNSFYWTVDGQTIGQGNVLNYNGLTPGLHKVEFIASGENKVSKDRIEIYVDNDDVSASIISPADNAVFKQGQIVSFNSLGDSQTDSNFEYEWSSNIDGILSSNRAFSTSELSVGKHIITLKVNNSQGLSIDKKTIYILPQDAPTASIISPEDGHTITEGSNLTLIAATNAARGAWFSDIQGLLGSSVLTQVSNLMVGLHKITFVGLDENNNYVVNTIEVQVTPRTAPTLTITSPSNGQTFLKGDSITFTATANDPDGVIQQWQWTSSIDGVIGTSQSFTLNNLSLGKHDITATVIDNDNNRYAVSASIWILINPAEAPTATIISPTNNAVFNVSDLIFFNGSSSKDDVSYRWESSIDGLLSTEKSFSTVLSEGVHTITFTVTDTEGLMGISTLKLTVQSPETPVINGTNQKPIVNINGPYVGYVGEPIQFSSAGSYDPDGSIVRYEWIFSVGAPAFVENPIRTFNEPGNYSVILTVTDDKGEKASASAVVVVKEKEVEQKEEGHISSRSAIYLSAVNLPNDGQFSIGDEVNVKMVFKNRLSETMRHVKITAIIPDLGLFSQAGPFNVGANQRTSKVLRLYIPRDAPKGEYYIRLSVYNDGHRRVIYRPIEIK